jgi:sugar phosphate isomerase/epimerase
MKLKYLAAAICVVFLMEQESGHAQSAQQSKLLFTNAIGVQMYTFRNSKKDPVAILDTLKNLGITEIEGGAPMGNKPDGTPYTRDEVKQLMTERGISVVSVGVNYNALKTDEGVMRAIANAKANGAQYIMCSWINFDKVFKFEDAKQAVEIFNRAGKLIRENGLTFAYHCHGYEFHPYEDGTLFDYIAKNTDPENVSFEIDILWAFFGGQDPAKLILKYGDRFKLMHVKDLRKGIKGDLTGLTSPMNDVAVGDGQLDIPSIMRAAKKVGIKHYFIEDESPLHAEQMPRTIAYLRSIKE